MSPVSPAGAARKQRAREKVKFKVRSIKKDYAPDEGSIVHQLSSELNSDGRAWWDHYGGEGKEFDEHKANRGSSDGAMAWVREKYVTEWWEQHYPNAKDALEADRVWFFKKWRHDKLIWAYLNNIKRKQDTKRERENDLQQQPNGKPRKSRKRAIGHDAYRFEHPEEYDKAVEEWLEEKGSKPNFNDKRKISYSVYKKLSNQEQKIFKDKATIVVKESQQLAKITDPQKRAKFIPSFCKLIREVLKDGFELLGIDVCALIVHETEDGQTRVTRELTEGIKKFSNSTRLAKCMEGLKEFLEAQSEPINDPRPSPRVYPDFSKDGYPCLPNFQGWGLKRLRKLLRDFIKAVFKFQGGVGRMPWKEIRGALHVWLDPQRLPQVIGLVWDDPSYLSKHMVLIWLNFFLACLTGAIPPGKCFQFRRILAGTTPIHPSESQETSREQVEQEGTLVYVLVFENSVTKCHRVGGMTYDQRAIDFASFVAFGSDHVDAGSAPPLRWLFLPTPGPNIPGSVFSEAELEHLDDVTSSLPEPIKTRVLTLADVTNSYQEHLPVSHPTGVWLREAGIPLALPRSPQEASNLRLLRPFWLPPEYFLPAGAGPFEGTLFCLERFQDDLRTGNLIVHKPSRTFYGGHTGISCVSRPLIQIYLNCLALRGDFQPPEPYPVDYEKDRFNVAEHSRIATWIDQLTTTIQQHTKILSETSAERKKGLTHCNVHPISPDSDSQRSRDSDSNSGSGSDSDSDTGPDVVPPTSPPSTPIPTKGKRKQPQQSRRFDDYDHGDAGSEQSDIDYEALDKKPEDDESSDEEAWNNFNNRFLDDDIFPPGDSIGLRERYNFAPEVEFHFHVACRPYDGVLPEDLWSPDNARPLFGSFPVLRPYKEPRLSRPDTIMRQLIALSLEALRAKQRWEFYDRENPRFGPELREWSKKESSMFAPAIQPLVRVVLSRLLGWLRAKAMAPYVFSHWTAMCYILRETLNLCATSKRLIDAGSFPDSEFTAEDLANQVVKCKLLIIELSYICEELRDWHALSTRFMDKLRGNWLISSLTTLGEVVSIVEGTLEWADATFELGAKHTEERPEKWQILLDVPFKPPEVRMNYLFGCPTRGEQPKDLEDSLIMARTMDPTISLTKASNLIVGLAEMLVNARKSSVQNSPVLASTSCPAPVSADDPAPVADSLVPPTQGSPAAGTRVADPDSLVLGLSVPPSGPSSRSPPAQGSPPAITRSGPRARPKIRPPPTPVPTTESASAAKPGPVMESTPGPEPTPIIELPLSQIERESLIAQASDCAGEEQSMSVDPPESETETTRTPAALTLALPSPELRRISNRQIEQKTTRLSPLPLLLHPPTTATMSERKQTRKRKSPLETETEMEAGSAKGKRVSNRLRAKAGLSINGELEEKSERRMSTRSGRK